MFNLKLVKTERAIRTWISFIKKWNNNQSSQDLRRQVAYTLHLFPKIKILLRKIPISYHWLQMQVKVQHRKITREISLPDTILFEFSHRYVGLNIFQIAVW